jgi:hypothetical protein
MSYPNHRKICYGTRYLKPCSEFVYMPMVYTHPNLLYVQNIKNLLSHAGIESVVQNQYGLGAIGELAPINVWPELWLARPHQYDQALMIIEQHQHPAATVDWVCTGCGEKNGGAFESCWQCQTGMVTS